MKHTNHILRIDGSARHIDSVTRTLTSELIAGLEPEHLTVRDLSDNIPLIDEAWVNANFTPKGDRSTEQQQTLALSDTLVAEIESADTLVIGLPVYNFTVPTSVKAWIDMIARAQLTFRYTENGPEGLLTGKKAYIIFASGGTPMGSDYDFASKYMKHILGFVGITDVMLISANQAGEHEGDPLEAARNQITDIINGATSNEAA